MKLLLHRLVWMAGWKAAVLLGLSAWCWGAGTSAAQAQLANGTFDANLVGWKAAWPVAVQGGAAVLDERQAPHVFLFQTVQASGGAIAVSFDFQNSLSAQSTSNAFRDSFYASLYEVADPADFITEHDQFSAAHGLMDLDAGGPFDVQGTIGAVPGREGWLRFTGTVSVSRPHVAMLFELYDLNFVAGDSAVRVDNVAIGPGEAR